MQLHEQNDERLTLVTLNVDFDKSAGEPAAKLIERVASVLSDNAMVCENLMSTTAMEDVLSEFEIFGLPAALLFDVKGDLKEVFDGETEGLQDEVLRLIASP